jgi:PAS domain S-box-containing protein
MATEEGMSRSSVPQRHSRRCCFLETSWTRRRRHLEELIRERTSLLWASRKETALLAAKFQGVFQHAPIGMALTDLEGQIMEANLALCKLLGYPAQELVGRRFADLICTQADIKGCADILLTGKDGKNVAVRCSTAAVKDDAGATLFAIIIVEDRTAHIEAERALNLASSVVRSSGDAIVTCDLRGLVTGWNPAAEKKFGISAHGAKGKNMWRLLPQELAEAAAARLAHINGPNDTQAFETTCSAGTGLTLEVSVTVSPISDDDGELVGWVVTARDITEQRRLGQEMARLDRLNTLGELAAGMGHEVRNPMTTVRGYLQLLKQKAEFAEYTRHFTLMIEELDRMNRIITEFLSIGAKKADAQRPYKLGTIIREVQPLLEAEALMREMNLCIDLSADDESLLLNTTEIRQLLLNLVRNGMDAMSPGGNLRISTARQGHKTVLGIEDTGCGIPPEVMQRLYTPFLTTKEKGTGLGLSICHNIAKRHNAEIQVAYSGSSGTRFEVIFKH